MLSQEIKHTFSQFVGAILIRYQHQTTGELSGGKTLVWEEDMGGERSCTEVLCGSACRSCSGNRSLFFSHSGLLFGQREIFSREEKNKSYFTKYLFSRILLVFFI